MIRILAGAALTALFLLGGQGALAQTIYCWETDGGRLCLQAPSGTPTILPERPPATVVPTSTTPPPLPATPQISPTVLPTSVPAPVASLEYGTWQPTQGDTCTRAVHDAHYVTVDGKRFSTWHPPVDPSGCTFGHEHGMDPRGSLADPTLPAFGYAVEHTGDMFESHAGFKVDYVNLGDLTATAEGGNLPSQFSSRTVVHMGTGGTARYSTQWHSVELDAIWPNGYFIHVNLMADTGPTELSGNANPAFCDEETRLKYFATPDDPTGTARHGAKDFSTIGCLDFYEIWNGATMAVWDERFAQFREPNSAAWFAAPAFDTPTPILTRDPANNQRVYYSMDHWRQIGEPYDLSFWDGVIAGTSADRFRGCQHGVYHGPHYFTNWGPEDYYTDAFGAVIADEPEPGAIRQRVARGAYVTESGSVVQAQAKTATDTCHPTVHAPN